MWITEAGACNVETLNQGLLNSLTKLLKGTHATSGNEIMNTTKLVMLVIIAVGLFILIPNLSWAADDGATIYKAKCAVCHGADAAGKPAATIPSLVSEEAKKTLDDDLAKAVTEKPKHPGMVKSLAPDQVKMVVSYVRSLQK
jgi:cytochrome c553